MCIGSGCPWFLQGSCQSSCPSARRNVARNVARAAECLPSVHAKEGSRWGKHSAGSRGRYENASRPSSVPGRDGSPPQAERRLSSFVGSPGARIPAPAKRAAVLVGVPGDITDFVQKQRAVVRQLQPATLLCDCTGEGTPLVPEKFTLEQTAGNGSAVE